MNRYIWQRRLVLFLISALMAGFGFTSIASADTITNTGPDSRNSIKTDIDNECKVKNDNDVSVKNRNWQDGTTGDATVSDNTGSGASWDGWDSLNPETAMAGGVSHDAWWNGVADWMAQRGTGDGWNSDGGDPSWAPSSDGWSAYDPMAWQANGQTFGNWWNGAQHYLDGNSGQWLLGWPQDATGSGGYGGNATTGSVVNRNNSNFTITVNNAASVKAGVDACGKRKFTPPSVTPPQCPCPPSVTPGTPGQPGITTPSMISPSGGAGGAGAGAGKGIGAAKVSGKGAGAPMNVSQAPSGGQGGANVPPPCPCMCPCPPPQPPKERESSISNTGPGSNNSISTEISNETTIKNTNDVTVNNSNWQSGSTGDATVTDNTKAGSATSGDIYNTNKTQVDVDISN